MCTCILSDTCRRILWLALHISAQNTCCGPLGWKNSKELRGTRWANHIMLHVKWQKAAPSQGQWRSYPARHGLRFKRASAGDLTPNLPYCKRSPERKAKIRLGASDEYRTDVIQHHLQLYWNFFYGRPLSLHLTAMAVHLLNKGIFPSSPD